MALPVQTFSQFLTNIKNALASAAPKKITNLLSGSIAYAIAQATTAAAMVLQSLIMAVYQACRLATSQGLDAVSFVADFGLTPLPPTQAFNQVQLTRAQTTGELDISLAVTNLLQTPVNKIQYAPIADTSQGSFDPIRQVYFFAPGQASILITAKALPQFIGSQGNCDVGAISQIAAGFYGVNTVSNPIAFTNGTDPETIPALKQRFQLYIAGLRTSNNAAVAFAIQSVQSNLTYQVMEYLHFDFSPWEAGFTVVVDDGSGNIATGIKNAVHDAVDATRAAGIEFAVFSPTNIQVNTAIHINIPTNGNLALIQSNVSAAIITYINGLGVGNNVNYVNLENVIQNVPGVYSYSGLLLNGIAGDVQITLAQLARAGIVNFVP